MEQIGNRISFVKGYTKTEKIAINTKIDRILKELSDMQLGPCSFKLSEEITCIYCQNSFHYSSDKTMGLTFKYKDYDENDSEYRNGHYDTYSAKSLFITEYERRLRQVELPDLTEDEIESFVKVGYGYDMYLKEGISETIKSCISYALTDNLFFIYKDDMQKLYDWIEKNPEKCLLPENRHPEKTEDIQEEEEKEM